MNETALDIINNLQLLEHPEGGYYKEIHRSELLLNRNSVKSSVEALQMAGTQNLESLDTRNLSTSIYYLLQEDDKSKFHRLKSDEIFYHHQGSSVTIYVLDQEGFLSEIYLGNNLRLGELPQVVIKAGNWFAAELRDKTSYCLMGCCVAPGFDFDDFELASDDLISAFPKYKELLKRFI